MPTLLTAVLALILLLSGAAPARTLANDDDCDRPGHSDKCKGDDDDGFDDDDDFGGNPGRWCGDLDGAGFGLCNAFCNAQECHLHWKNSCDQLRRNFEKQTGFTAFPCEEGVFDYTPTPRTARSFTPTRTPRPPTPTRTMQTPTQTPTGPTRTTTATRTPPAAGGFCGDLEGAAFGLCNAFCNAQACHIEPGPGCDELRRNFRRHTGTSVFPCETDDGRCVWDCDNDGHVTISDLTRTIRIVLGFAPVSACDTMKGRQRLTIDDLVSAVRSAMDGC